MHELDDLLRLTRRLRLSATERVQPRTWRPATDIYRTGDGWLVKVELAGVRPEEIRLHASGRTLTVTGRRWDMEHVKGVEYHALEIAYNRFARTVELPCDLESAQLETEYRNGMLLVHVRTQRCGP